MNCNCPFHRYDVFHIVQKGEKYEARSDSIGEAKKMETEIEHNKYAWKDVASVPIEDYFHGIEKDQKLMSQLWKKYIEI